jgi:Cytidine deaminase
MAEAATKLANNGMDTRSDYGVGATVKLDNGNMYKGMNIRFSGMEYTVHAEQLAMFQAIADIETAGLDLQVKPEKIMVVTSEQDGAIVCGHCLQVISGMCDYYGWDTSEIEYTAAVYGGEESSVKQFHRSEWEFDKYMVNELVSDTYVQNRD